MNVGMVKLEILKELERVCIVLKPLEADGEFEADPSHAEVVGLPLGDSDKAIIIGELIARCVVSLHPTSSNACE